MHPSKARTLSLATSSRINQDGSVLASAEKVPEHDCYYLEMDNPLGKNVTGFRLEMLPDASLPKGGPGMMPETGNFVLGEINVFDGFCK